MLDFIFYPLLSKHYLFLLIKLEPKEIFDYESE
jgi:hypothetical protein